MKHVKIAITTAEVKLQSASLPQFQSLLLRCSTQLNSSRVINSANKAATEELPQTISNFMTQLNENQNARPAGDPRPVHPTLNRPARLPATPSTTLPPQVPDNPAFPSYAEISKRNLPSSYKATDSFDKDLKERTSVFEKANIVRSTQSHRSPRRRLAATPSDLRPIYGGNIQHQPVSNIMKNLRDVLVVPEAARWLSIFRLDSTGFPEMFEYDDEC